MANESKSEQSSAQDLSDNDLDQVQGGLSRSKTTSAKTMPGNEKSLLDYDWIAVKSTTGSSKGKGTTRGVVDGFDNTN